MLYIYWIMYNTRRILTRYSKSSRRAKATRHPSTGARGCLISVLNPSSVVCVFINGRSGCTKPCPGFFVADEPSPTNIPSSPPARSVCVWTSQHWGSLLPISGPIVRRLSLCHLQINSPDQVVENPPFPLAKNLRGFVGVPPAVLLIYG